MADLYVQAIDKPLLADEAHTIRQLKAGDVVEILEDDQGPGKAVEKSGAYKVIRVPGTRADWQYLMASNPFDSQNIQPKRIKSLDIVAIYSAPQQYKVPHSRMGECISVPANFVKGIEFVKPLLPSELVI